MKILLLGSLISTRAMEELNNNSKEKASVAPVNYETMLAKGLTENGAQVEAYSVPAVAAYPHSRYKRMRAKSETLDFGVRVKWLPFINIQLIKQITIRRSVKKALKTWLQDNRDVTDKVVMMYSIYPPYTVPAIRLCRKYGCHLNAVITDLPEYMYTWKQSTGLKGLYARHLRKQMLALQGQADSYILFTQKMAARMGIQDKPYLVSEGFSDAGIYEEIPAQDKHEQKTIVYAGNLSRLYGIRTLVDGFMLTEGDYELHLYGAGVDAAYIESCAKQDPRIRYFGRVSRCEALTALKRAHLIVINKPTADDYSEYSFSSKILECMTSGTPVLTTRVGGMPVEYYEHVYFIEDETPQGVASEITRVLELPEAELAEKGRRACTFAVREKNYVVQGKKAVDFLRQCLNV